MLTRSEIRFAGVPVFSTAFIIWLKCLFKHYWFNLKKPRSLEDLTARHFKYWSEANHTSRAGLELALRSVSLPRLIIETGTSAWGCDSSRLLNMYAEFCGAEFISVDIRADASNWLKLQTSKSTRFYVCDSVHFLENTFPREVNKTIDFVYLDSYDLDLTNPLPAENHCLREFNAVLKYSRRGTIIVIDDTRASVAEFPQQDQQIVRIQLKNNGRIPGKGALVLEKIRNNSNFEILWHRENLVVRVLSDSPNIENV